ncbi:MAG: sugar phosphate isomerase/epimerase [Candidatus Atribacteria bacterium]|nr:sugar phosphate isomerase/epimerase [Candidatus Atribacteria bacterium]
MKIGVFMNLFQNETFEKALDYVKSLGIEAVEIGTGAYAGQPHCDVDLLLKDNQALESYRSTVESRGLFISALNCSGNPLHPNPAIAQPHHQDFEKTVLLAEKLEIQNVIAFSGCPGDSEDAKYPNWVTCPWPNDYSEMVAWQWKEKVIPYWEKAARFAKDHHVRICFEMHPGLSVYNPETLLRLRGIVGDVVGANFDPSHLFWQGIDPIVVIRKFKDAIFHIHAKDTKIDPINSSLNGNLDFKTYKDEINRSWIFRTVGYGHDIGFWKEFVSTLRLVGYDGVLSIEHEDSLLSKKEGLEKAVDLLKEVIIHDTADQPWWI